MLISHEVINWDRLITCLKMRRRIPRIVGAEQSCAASQWIGSTRKVASGLGGHLVFRIDRRLSLRAREKRQCRPKSHQNQGVDA